MKRFQLPLASFFLLVALAAPAAGADGIIHTGNPSAPPPPPAPSGLLLDDDLPDGDTPGGETTEGGTTTLDLVLEAAFDCLHATLTLF